jgi:single-strand DNA-binding protein
MSLNEPAITVHGHLTDRPAIRFLESGTAVAEFTVAQNPRFRNAAGEWVDGEPVFLRGKVWRDLAESVAESLNKGDRVTVVGRLRRRTWEDKETGAKRFVDEIDADDVAVSLRGQRVRVAKLARDRSPGTPPEPPDDDG